MKQIFIALLLATTLSSCNEPNADREARSTVSQLSENEIEVLLPKEVKVYKTDGETPQGSLEAIDDNSLILDISIKSLSIDIKEVEAVEFSGDVRFYSTNEIVIRGISNEEQSDDEPDFSVPIADFRVGERGKDMAIVDLTSVDNREGFIDGKNNRHLIVRSMKFEPSGNPEELQLKLLVEMR